MALKNALRNALRCLLAALLSFGLAFAASASPMPSGCDHHAHSERHLRLSTPDDGAQAEHHCKPGMAGCCQAACIAGLAAVLPASAAPPMTAGTASAFVLSASLPSGLAVAPPVAPPRHVVPTC